MGCHHLLKPFCPPKDIRFVDYLKNWIADVKIVLEEYDRLLKDDNQRIVELFSNYTNISTRLDNIFNSFTLDITSIRNDITNLQNLVQQVTIDGIIERMDEFERIVNVLIEQINITSLEQVYQILEELRNLVVDGGVVDLTKFLKVVELFVFDENNTIIGSNIITNEVKEDETSDALAVVTRDGILRKGLVFTDDTDKCLLSNGTWGKLPSNIIYILYENLKNSMDDDQLSPGQTYCITDYIATCNSDYGIAENTCHIDIYITAKDFSSFFEDVLFNYNWHGKYSINNDTERFAWGVSDGKGVIYELTDEFNNTSTFDFKNIKVRVPIFYGSYGNNSLYEIDINAVKDLDFSDLFQNEEYHYLFEFVERDNTICEASVNPNSHTFIICNNTIKPKANNLLPLFTFGFSVKSDIVDDDVIIKNNFVNTSGHIYYTPNAFGNYLRIEDNILGGAYSNSENSDYIFILGGCIVKNNTIKGRNIWINDVLISNNNICGSNIIRSINDTETCNISYDEINSLMTKDNEEDRLDEWGFCNNVINSKYLVIYPIVFNNNTLNFINKVESQDGDATLLYGKKFSYSSYDYSYCRFLSIIGDNITLLNENSGDLYLDVHLRNVIIYSGSSINLGTQLNMKNIVFQWGCVVNEIFDDLDGVIFSSRYTVIGSNN